MNPPKFLCPSDSLIEGQFSELEIEREGDRLFLVATRYQGRPRVWLNICPHQGRPLNWAPNQFLSDKQGNLVCAAHGAVFEPGEGICVSGPCLKAGLSEVPVSESESSIFLD